MNTLERAEIKEVIREIMREDKVFFKTILREIAEEPVQDVKPVETGPDRTNPDGANPGRAEKIDEIIHRDFERYHNVFKALA